MCFAPDIQPETRLMLAVLKRIKSLQDIVYQLVVLSFCSVYFDLS
jgi:hypothetical protein